MSLQNTQLVGFGGGSAGGAVTFIGLDGTTNFGVNNVKTFSGQSSAGPITVLGLTWVLQASSVRTITSWTFDGNDITILVEAGGTTNGEVGCAIGIITGSFSSKDVVATLSGSSGGAGLTILSFADIVSFTPVDTDFNDAAFGATNALASLTNPSANGVTLTLHANETNSSAGTWTNVTETSDEDIDVGGGPHRHSMAYGLGVLAGDADPNFSAVPHITAGVSLD